MARPTLLAILVIAMGAAAWPTAAASDMTLYSWHIPYPFGTNASSPGDAAQSLHEPRKSFRARGPMGSSARFTGLRWTGWGTRKAVGRGTGRYCVNSSCRARRRVTITLTRPVSDCLGATFSYTRYRLTNFKPYLSRTLVSADTPGC